MRSDPSIYPGWIMFLTGSWVPLLDIHSVDYALNTLGSQELVQLNTLLDAGGDLQSKKIMELVFD